MNFVDLVPPPTHPSQRLLSEHVLHTSQTQFCIFLLKNILKSSTPCVCVCYHFQTLQILGPQIAVLKYIAGVLPRVMPNPSINITTLPLTSWVAALVNQAVDDYSELFELNATSTGVGGIDLIPIKAGMISTGELEFDGLFVDPVAIADLTVAGSMMDLTPILAGDVDWWVNAVQVTF